MLQNFLAELKRRKVLRVVGAYAVVSWGVLQVADRLFSALMLPQWTVTFVAVMLLLGLPITAVITWAFTGTQVGFSRTRAGSRSRGLSGCGRSSFASAPSFNGTSVGWLDALSGIGRTRAGVESAHGR